MGKKNKNKFKKQIKAQLLQEMTQAHAQPSTQAITTVDSKPSDITIKPSVATEPITENAEFNLTQIKYDLKKTAIVILILAIFIGVLYYLDLKYGILLHFGSWLFKILNIK